MKKIFIIYGFTFIFTGCMFLQPDYLTVISPEKLNKIMQNEDVFLVDVHTPKQRHIKGTDVFIPYNEVEKFEDKLPENKATPIYIYCEGGPMGNAAARSLYALGYKNLFNLEGGEKAWRNAGLPLE